MTEATPQAALAEIAAAIAEARRAVADGAFVELSGLDRAVTGACEAALAMPAAERPAFAEGLASLADALEGLALEIARQRDAAGRQRALDAYGGADGA